MHEKNYPKRKQVFLKITADYILTKKNIVRQIFKTIMEINFLIIKYHNFDTLLKEMKLFFSKWPFLVLLYY